LTESRNLEELTLSGCQMRLCEEDICMLASLPLLQPVIFMGPRGYQYKLDVVREESDLGIPPILIVIGDNGVRCCRVTTRMNTGRPGG
jgi:hypothetical protein